MKWQLTAPITTWSTTPCSLRPFLALGEAHLCMEYFATCFSHLVCFSRQATRHIPSHKGGRLFQMLIQGEGGGGLWCAILFPFQLKTTMESKGKQSMQSTGGKAPRLGLQVGFAASRVSITVGVTTYIHKTHPPMQSPFSYIMLQLKKAGHCEAHARTIAWAPVPGIKRSSSMLADDRGNL